MPFKDIQKFNAQKTCENVDLGFFPFSFIRLHAFQIFNTVMFLNIVYSFIIKGLLRLDFQGRKTTNIIRHDKMVRPGFSITK